MAAFVQAITAHQQSPAAADQRSVVVAPEATIELESPLCGQREVAVAIAGC
jgi:hypothetical protein